METNDLRWEKNSSLKDMMDRFNGLVDEMQRMQGELNSLEQNVAAGYGTITEQFHELNDKILTVNYKTDEMRQHIAGRLDDILRTISLNHPGI